MDFQVTEFYPYTNYKTGHEIHKIHDIGHHFTHNEIWDKYWISVKVKCKTTIHSAKIIFFVRKDFVKKFSSHTCIDDCKLCS